MATAQQVQFAETIRAMKVAMKRRPDESDSDFPISTHTNRGHKLHRRAQFVRTGRLDDTGGLPAYKRRVQHAGYTRSVVALNPARYDVDGDTWSPTESDIENERAPPDGVDTIIDDAFGGVKIEEILRPLTRAAELQNHPSLRVPFTNAALTQMTEETLEMVRCERETLWKAKRLLLRFRGDGDWMPCGRFESEGDDGLLDNERDEFGAENSAGDDGIGNGDYAVEQGAAMDGVEVLDMAPGFVEDMFTDERIVEATRKDDDDQDASVEKNIERDDSRTHDKALRPPDGAAAENPTVVSIRDRSRDADAGSENTSTSGKETNGTNAPSHSMTTRARARSPVASDPPSPTHSDSSSIPSVSPWFLPPPDSLPDRDFGLLDSEAEETRRLLLLYVQKQENVVRSLETLYDGLQRTDRLRHEVYRACKAEGHLKDDGKGNLVTEMSDGEDWYDPSEWNLQPWELKVGKDGAVGLEKGKDEVEDIEEEGRRGAGRRRRVNRM